MQYTLTQYVFFNNICYNSICNNHFFYKQVFGKRPFERRPSLPTSELAKLVVRQYNLEDADVALYTRHLALLVSSATLYTILIEWRYPKSTYYRICMHIYMQRKFIFKYPNYSTILQLHKQLSYTTSSTYMCNVSMCTNEAVLTSCSLCTANHRRWRLATRTEQTVATIQCSTRRQLMCNNTHKSTDARADRIEWAQKFHWSREETQGRRGTPKMWSLTWISLWLTQLCASFFAMSAMYPQLSLRCSAARVLMRFWLWTIRILRLSLWVL